MEPASIMMDISKKTLTFDIPSTKILPAYLHYLLQYKGIPEDYDMIFTDKSVRLVKVGQDYKYERID